MFAFFVCILENKGGMILYYLRNSLLLKNSIKRIT